MVGRKAAEPPPMHDVTAPRGAWEPPVGTYSTAVGGINADNNCNRSGQCPGNRTPKAQQWQVHTAAAQML